MMATCVEELRTLAAPERLDQDIRERRFVEHTLQIAIQAALDVASHIVSDRRLGEPKTNRALFDLLAQSVLLEPSLADRLGDMAGFRNVLVHGYTDVDLGVLREILAHRLVDLEDFIDAMRPN